MLYWLYTYFNINILHYITVRAGISFFISFFLTLYLMPIFIRWAKSKNANQPIYDKAPKNHNKKAKTPTMGGIVFISSAIFSTLLSAKLNNFFIIGSLFVLISFSAIGFKDDMAKILSSDNQEGLTPRMKFILQTLFAFLVSLFLYLFALNGDFYIPFYKYPLFNMGFFAVIFWTLVIVSTSNAVNLTDGLDGLATVPSIFALFSLAIFAYLSGHAILSEYLFLPNIKGVGEAAIVAMGLIGSLLGFLWYNCHPAEIFMGDTGSLSVGAFIGYMAVITKNEILLLAIGFIFVLETVSVILQVGSFKTRQKRIFRMAPIHHHFEMKGWVENKIIVRFWIIALISNIIALITIKIR